MTSTSKKFTTSAATLFAFAFFVMTAPTAQADDYCITFVPGKSPSGINEKG